MKLATVKHEGDIKAGVIVDDAWLDVHAAGPDAETWVSGIIAAGRPDGAQAALQRIPLTEVGFLPPILQPRNALICVGKNYFDHAQEFQNSGFDSSASEMAPSSPVIFTKSTSSVIGAGEAVRASLDPTHSVDYEGELGVVIGRKAFQVSRQDAYAHVFGYTIINDVTSRELQKRHRQWFIGKSLDTFAPIGPWIVTGDEIANVAELELITRVNDEVRQKALVRDLIFDIPNIIETLSETQTLMPGDIIATGTPAGVGIGFQPPRYLHPGDRVSVSISGIGTLENPII